MTDTSQMNPFASKVLIITVGPNKTQFNIHEALLRQKSTFFEAHTVQNGGKVVKGQQEESEMAVKAEGSPGTESSGTPGVQNTSASASSVDTPSNTPSDTPSNEQFVISNYHLETHFVKAFAIFVDWLYNSGPQVPKTLPQCKILIQAYLLARKYTASNLQDVLLDRIRGYHVEHAVDFDALFVYLVNRCKDDVDCKLIRYFIDQIAYEIADTSGEDFASKNGGFERFLTDRPTCKARSVLFYRVAEVAALCKRGYTVKDPAVIDGRERDYYI